MHKCFSWVVLVCFVLHVALYFSTSHIVGKSLVYLEQQDQEATLSEEGEDESPIELMLEEYLDLIEDFPRTDTSKPSSKSANNVCQGAFQPVLQRIKTLLPKHWNSIAATPAPYRPLSFLLSEYHGYLFRLTPF